jgi:hypothetical protein
MDERNEFIEKWLKDEASFSDCVRRMGYRARRATNGWTDLEIRGERV